MLLLVVYSVTLPLYKLKVYLIMPNQLALFAVRQFDYFIYQDQKLNSDGQNIHNTHTHSLYKVHDLKIKVWSVIECYKLKNYIYFKISI